MPQLGGVMPEPLTQAPASTIGPGSSAGIFRGRLVIVFGPSGTISGVFVYATGTTPGLGNPPVFWASSSLLDPFGNVLPAQAGVSGTSTFAAGNSFLDSRGLRAYSGTPAAGNLVISVNPGAFYTDSFGNSVDIGIGIYNETTGAALVLNSGQAQFFAGINVLALVSNIGVFLYNASNPAQLLVSVSSQSGTDAQSSTAFPAGLQAQSMNFINQGSNPAAGPNGPTLYSDNTGTALQLTSQTGMTPQLVGGNTSTQHFTVTQTAATFTSRSWQVAANDPQAGTHYRLTVRGNGLQGTTAQSLHLGVQVAGTNFAEVALTSTVVAASASFSWGSVYDLFFDSVGSSGVMQVFQNGSISQFGATLTNSNSLGFAGQNSNNTINTTAAFSVTAYAFWFANAGAPSLTALGSSFERLGA